MITKEQYDALSNILSICREQLAADEDEYGIDRTDDREKLDIAQEALDALGAWAMCGSSVVRLNSTPAVVEYVATLDSYSRSMRPAIRHFGITVDGFTRVDPNHVIWLIGNEGEGLKAFRDLNGVEWLFHVCKAAINRNIVELYFAD